MDLAQSLLALAAVLSPLAAAVVIAATAPRRRRAANLAQLSAGLTAGLAALALLRTLWNPAATNGAFSLGTWLRFGSQEALTISLGLRWDIGGEVLTLVIAFSTLCALAWQERESDSETGYRREAGACLLLFSAIGTVMATNLGEFFVFWQLAAAASYLLRSTDPTRTRASLAARRLILVQQVGSVLLLVAIFAIGLGFRTLDFERLFASPAGWSRLAWPQEALVELIALCLLGAVAARSAIYPLFGWVDDLGDAPPFLAALLEGICLAPTGAVLLLRCLPVITTAVHASSLAAFVAGGSAFLAAASARGALGARRGAAFACLSVLLVVVFGLFSAVEWSGLDQTLLLAAYVPLSAAILGGLGLPLETMAAGPGSQRFGSAKTLRRVLLSISAGLLFSGVCGQGRLMAGMLLAISTRQKPALTSGIATVLVGLAEFIAALAIARMLREPGELQVGLGWPETPEDESPAVEPPGWSMFALTACGLAGGLACLLVPVFVGTGRLADWAIDTATALLACLPGLAGLLAGRLRPRPLPSFGPAPVSEGELTRLGRSRFHADALLFLSIALPLRGAAQLARFVDWFFLDSVVTGVPESFAQSAVRLFDPVQRRAPAFYVSAAAFGVLVLAGMIVWLRS